MAVSKNILRVFAVALMIFLLCGCGGVSHAANNEETIDTANTSVNDSDNNVAAQSTESNSNSRLDQLMNQANDNNAAVEAEKQRQEEERKAEEARQEEERKQARAEITSNDALLDALVGEWGFILPRFINKSNVEVQPELVCLYFSEYGGGSITQATDRVGGFNDGEAYIYDPVNFEYAIDEANNKLFIFYDKRGNDSNLTETIIQELQFAFENGELLIKGPITTYYSRVWGEEYFDYYYKADWDYIWNEMLKQKSVNMVADKYSQYQPVNYIASRKPNLDNMQPGQYYLPTEIEISSIHKTSYIFEYSGQDLITKCTIRNYNGDIEEISLYSPFVFHGSTRVFEYGSDRITEIFKRSSGEVYCQTVYDLYGNMLISNMMSDNSRASSERAITLDEHHNIINDNIKNIYDDHGNLVEVKYDRGNLHKSAVVKYMTLDVENMPDNYMDIIWRSIRLCCGDDIWD